MKQSRSFLRVLSIAICSAIALLLTTSATYADAAKPQPLAEKSAKKLPLTGTFARGTPGENGGPYALTLKNTSQEKLTVNATIVWSVTSHNRANTIKLPVREMAAGESWTIDDLAAEDRVILEAEGFEKLEFKTPPKK